MAAPTRCAAARSRILVGDVISHLTFSNTCAITGEDQLIHIPGGTLPSGRRLRLHTGRGTDAWVMDIMHIYLNRNWFVWNNACGDRATVRYQNQVIDTAGYTPNPPEGVLVRIRGTNRLEPVARYGYGTYGNRF